VSADMTMWPDDGGNGAQIDAAIDEAARRITDGAPGVDFKARVLARLGEREPGSDRRRLAWMLAPIAAAVIISFIIVGRFVDSGDRGSDHPATQSQSMQTVRQQPQPTPAASAAQSPTRQTPTSVRLKPDTTYATAGSRRSPGDSREPRVARSEVDALAPDALDVESIRLAPLAQAASIRVAPLDTIDPIAVAPLATLDIDDPQRREP
jgi:hypothetical protein